jgi:hypothetical protein
MKVSFSASFNNLPEIINVLQSCDLVMTTQNRPSQLENLQNILGQRTKLCILPIGFGWGNDKLIEVAALMTGTPIEEIEAVTFRDLCKIREAVAPDYYENKKYGPIFLSNNT